jgi:integrase
VHVTVREKPNGKHEVRWLEASGRRRGRTFTRERDAIRFAAKTRTVLELGGVVILDEEIPTLAAFVEEYWRVHAIPNLSANTRATYKRVWVKHVLPRLGDMRLRAITPGVVNLQLVQPMRRAGAGDAVIRKTLGMLQGVFGLAVVHDLVPTNPVRPVRKPPQRRREAKPLWPTLVEAIRAQLGPRDATLVSVLAYAGLRPEEALALRWRDVRVDGLVIERALALGEFRRTKTGHERTVTSSRRSRRTSPRGGWPAAGPPTARSSSRAPTAASGRTTTGATGAGASTSPPPTSRPAARPPRRPSATRPRRSAA